MSDELTAGKRLPTIPPGTRYGRLTVLVPIANVPKYGLVYQCQCDCGNITTARSTRLHRGIIKSCGCLKKADFDTKYHLREAWKKEHGAKLGEIKAACARNQRFTGRPSDMVDLTQEDRTRYQVPAVHNRPTPNPTSGKTPRVYRYNPKAGTDLD